MDGAIDGACCGWPEDEKEAFALATIKLNADWLRPIEVVATALLLLVAAPGCW